MATTIVASRPPKRRPTGTACSCQNLKTTHFRPKPIHYSILPHRGGHEDFLSLGVSICLIIWLVFGCLASWNSWLNLRSQLLSKFHTIFSWSYICENSQHTESQPPTEVAKKFFDKTKLTNKQTNEQSHILRQHVAVREMKDKRWFW